MPTKPQEQSSQIPAGTAAGAAAAWDRQASGTADPREAAGGLRRRGLLQTLVGLIIGSLFWFFWHRGLAPFIWALAGLNGLAAVLSPTGVYAAISKGLEAFGRGIGRLLTVLLLTPLFWFFFAPFGFLFRRGHRDRLKRQKDAAAISYWIRRPAEDSSLDRYERQY